MSRSDIDTPASNRKPTGVLARTWLLAAGVMSGLFISAGCGGGGCDLDGCLSTENADIDLEHSAAELASATLRACRNDHCHEASLASLAAAVPRDMSYVVGLDAPDDASDSEVSDVTAYFGVGDESVHVQVSWWLATSAVRDGDRIHINITNASGDVLFDAAGETYNVREYGGDESCDKPSCRSAPVALN